MADPFTLSPEDVWALAQPHPTIRTLAEVEAAVAARLSEPIDGSGLRVAQRAQRLAEALAQGKVDQLAHELGNVLVPLRLFTVRLTSAALPTDRDGDVFTSAVRVLVAVERLIALHTASCRVADEQASEQTPPIFPAPMPGVYVTNQTHDTVMVEGADAEKLKVMGDALLQALETDENAFALRSPFRSAQLIPNTTLTPPESRFGREPATKVEFITAPGTIDEQIQTAIRAKWDSVQTRRWPCSAPNEAGNNTPGHGSCTDFADQLEDARARVRQRAAEVNSSALDPDKDKP